MEQEEKKSSTLTGVDLSQTASLLLPWTHDPWGKLRPPLSEDALCMSAELASAAYGMAIEPWVEAGWRDVTPFSTSWNRNMLKMGSISLSSSS